jgi:hypothetical protein
MVNLLKGLGLFCALVLLGHAGDGWTEVIFDNYGGVHTWFPYGREVTGPLVLCDPRWDQAMRFTVPTGVGGGFMLESASIPVYLRYGGPCPAYPNTTLSVSVYSDAGGAPGVPLATVQVTAALRGAPEDVTVDFGGAILLVYNATYWLVLSGNGDSDHGWLKPIPAVATSSGVYRELGGEWQSTDADDLAFKIEGTRAVAVDPTSWSRVKALHGRSD